MSTNESGTGFDSGGEGCDAGSVDECDAYVEHQPRVDQRARKAIEVEGHALFKAGKLDAAAEEDIRARLLKACAGLEAEVAISWLTLTSPTGRYGDNPEVLEFF